MTRISVITVAYNSASTIGDTCNSIAEQTHGDVQHIVVDGASRDATCEVVRRQCRTGAVIVSERDAGIYDAMNKGLGLATGDIVGFLNADDVFADSHVLSRVAVAMSDVRVDACFADLVYVDQHDLGHVRRIWKAEGCKPGSLSIGWIPPHPTLYVRKHIYAQVGGFDLAYKLAADHEMMCRLLSRKGVRAKYVPEVWVRMRLGGATNRNYRNIIKQNIEIGKSLLKNKAGISPLIPLYKILDRIRQRLSVGTDGM